MILETSNLWDISILQTDIVGCCHKSLDRVSQIIMNQSVNEKRGSVKKGCQHLSYGEQHYLSCISVTLNL